MRMANRSLMTWWNVRGKSMVTVWCYHVNMEQKLRGKFPVPWWALKNWGSSEGKRATSEVNLIMCKCKWRLTTWNPSSKYLTRHLHHCLHSWSLLTCSCKTHIMFLQCNEQKTSHAPLHPADSLWYGQFNVSVDLWTCCGGFQGTEGSAPFIWAPQRLRKVMNWKVYVRVPRTGSPVV